jgi:aminopeptidase YwaD
VQKELEWLSSRPRTEQLIVRHPHNQIAQSTVLAEQLASQGAVGLLLPQALGEDGYLSKPVMAASPAPLPVLVMRSDILPGPVGAQVRAGVSVQRVLAAGAHILGHIPGSDLALVNAPLLIGAHYDGVGDDPGGARIPGAADNVAGVAVVRSWHAP